MSPPKKRRIIDDDEEVAQPRDSGVSEQIDKGSESEDSSDSSSSDSSSSGSSSSSVDESEFEDESEGETTSPKARAPKRVRQFFEEEAGEGSEEEEEEEETEEQRQKRDRDLERLRREMAQRKQAGSHRLKSVIERIEERAKDDRGVAPGASDVLQPFLEDEYESDMEISGRLPTFSDDKLFIVRVSEPGKERQVIAQLTVKAAEFLKSGKPVPVTSFFCVDSLRGWLYVEGPSESATKEWLMGIRRVQGYACRLVPRSEWLGVFKTAEREAETRLGVWESGQWVRLKGRPGIGKAGHYAADIGKIKSDLGDGAVEVLLVPRIGSAANGRPAPALFEVELKPPGDVERVRDPRSGEVFNTFQGERFTESGFLVRRFQKSALLREEAGSISAAEKTAFERGSRAPAVTMSAAPDFRLGDKVVAISTDLKGIQGKVVAVDRERRRVTVEAALGGPSNTSLQFGFSEISKTFSAGDHVKIVSGEYEGESGIVTKSNSIGVALVVLDSSSLEVAVPGSSLSLSSEISRGESSVSGVTVGDLCSIRGQPAVVVRVSKGGQSAALLANGTRVDLAVNELAGRQVLPGKGAFAVSKQGEAFSVGAIVKLPTGQSGSVKFITRGAVFLKIREKAEDAGWAVSQGRDCTVVSQADTPKPVLRPQNVPEAKLQVSSAPRRPFGASNLVGKQVRIIRGTFKGYTATVRDEQDNKIQVSLDAKFKILTLPKDHIRAADEPEAAFSAPGNSDALTRGPADNALSRGPPTTSYLEPRTPLPDEFMAISEDDSPAPKVPTRFGPSATHSASSSVLNRPDSARWLVPGAVCDWSGEKVAISRVESLEYLKVRLLSQPGVFKVLQRSEISRADPAVGDRVKVLGSGLVGELLGFQSGDSGDDAIVMANGDVHVVAQSDVFGWAP